jgi:outer membrane protein assembly factor BamB
MEAVRVMRRLFPLAVLAAVLAACGGSAQRPTTATTMTTVTQPKPQRTAAADPVKTAKLVVTVLDGDRRKRVPGARVKLWHRAGHTGKHGATVIKAPRLRLEVTVSAKGYTTVHKRVNFKHRRHQTIRIYQPRLQWPLYGATPARTQAQTHIRLRPPFRLVWSRGLGRLIEFPAVVSDGFAYISNSRGTVRSISMRDGKVAWRHDTPGFPRTASSPAVDGPDLVYHTMAGRVYVLDRANGKLRWTWNAGAAIESSPVVRDGIDYFGTANGMVYALDLRRHRLVWSRALGAKITASAALVGRTLYIGDYSGRLWALAAASGLPRWAQQVNGRIYGTPAVSGGRIFVPSSTGDSLTAFSTTGRYLWRFAVASYVYSAPAVWDGHVCFGSYDGWFYSVSASSGRLLWRVPTGGPISGAAVIVAGVAYAGSFSHRIVGVDVRTGRTVLNFPHGDYVPVSGNGMRLLLHGFARIYAVEPRRKKSR